MKAITVRDLAIMCSKAIQKGLGDKKILLTNDDEWNGYHELFGGLYDPSINPLAGGQSLPYGVTPDNIKDYVILG